MFLNIVTNRSGILIILLLLNSGIPESNDFFHDKGSVSRASVIGYLTFTCRDLKVYQLYRSIRNPTDGNLDG